MADETIPAIPTGPGAAAILSAAVGCAALSVLTLAADVYPSVAAWLTMWKPSGPLSGVTDGAVLIWLVLWFALDRLWAHRDIDLRRVNIASGLLIGCAVALTFPPIADALIGK